MTRFRTASICCAALALGLGLAACAGDSDRAACASMAGAGLRPVAAEREERFLGKVQEDTARCRGGERAVARRDVPWLDWAELLGDRRSRARSRGSATLGHLERQRPRHRRRAARPRVPAHRADQVQPVRQQRHLSATTCAGADGVDGPALKVVAADAAAARTIRTTRRSAATAQQLCRGELIRCRTLTGICNDISNPLMGSARHAVRAQRRSSRPPSPSSATTSSPATGTATASACSRPIRR